MSEKLIEYLTKEFDRFNITKETIEKLKEFLLIHPEITDYNTVSQCFTVSDESRIIYVDAELEIDNVFHTLTFYLIDGDIIINHEDKVGNFITESLQNSEFYESAIYYHLKQQQQCLNNFI